MLDDPADDDFPIPAAVAGATLLAAGVVLTVNRLRRRQARHCPPGRLIPLAKNKAQQAERLLRAGAATKPANRLDLALRLLAHQLALTENADETRIEAVRVDGERIEILLTQPTDAPPGPFEQAEGKVWTLLPETDDPALTLIANQQTAPAPALATVGLLEGTPS